MVVSSRFKHPLLERGIDGGRAERRNRTSIFFIRHDALHCRGALCVYLVSRVTHTLSDGRNGRGRGHRVYSYTLVTTYAALFEMTVSRNR